MNGGPIAWQVKVQDDASGGGSPESEYKALNLAASNTVWLRHLCHALGYTQDRPTVIFEDNQSAIDFSHNPINQSLLKHVDVKYHVIRDWLREGKINIQKIDTAANLADMFTKAMQAPTFWTLVQQVLHISEELHRYRKRK
jgi:hypothetical protein